MSKRILRIESASVKTGVPVNSIYAMVRAGEFPKPVPLSDRRSGFLENELDEWIDARVAARDSKIEKGARR